MGHLFINEIESGRPIDDIYMVSQPVLRSTTRGDLYIAMFLSDKTGKLNARIWQASEETYGLLPKPGFVHINGRSETYQNNLQLVINQITVISPEEVDLADFLPKSKKDIEQMFGEVKNILNSVKSPQLRAIIKQFISDEELMKNFKTAPAAMVHHHNYLGGLLEHTVSMLKVAEAILPLYPKVESDLVKIAIFLHDLGKTKELSYEMAFSYTDAGQLVGHIVQTVVMLNKKVDELKVNGTEIDKQIVTILEHIILAHHGKYEFGSPKLPAMAEAFMVNYIDDLDAKMNQVARVIEEEPGDGDWTQWVRALETRLYRKKVLE